MLTEIRKRPFVRPLLVWITGILLSAIIYSPVGIGGMLIFVLTLMLLSFILSKYSNLTLFYSNRWVGGGVLLFLVLVLSYLISIYSNQHPNTAGKVKQQSEDIRLRFVESIDKLQLDDQGKSVLATLTLGYKQVLSPEVREKFSVTGVSHILAVSGFHVAVVAAFLSLLFSFLPTNAFFVWFRYFSMLLLVWSFVYVSGLAASAIRAGVMFSFYQTGRVLRRSSDSYNTLAASAFCMLVYSPSYLFDIGFQLSYLAVFSILYFRPRLASLIPVRNPILAVPWGWITITIAAQIGTLFLCLYYFGRFSVVFLYANLPVLLFANLLIPLGLIWLLLPPSFPGYSLLQEIVEVLTRLLMSVVDFIASFPGASLSFSFDKASLITGYGILLLGIFYFRKKRSWMLFCALALLFLLLLIRLIHRTML